MDGAVLVGVDGNQPYPSRRKARHHDNALRLFKFPFHALGTPNEIQVYATGENDAHRIADLIIADITAVERLYSRYRPASLLSRINAAAGTGQRIQVDAETAGLLDFASACYEQSEGLFDITSGVLRRAWDFQKKIVPSQVQLDELLPLIGWDKVEWRKPYIYLPLPGMQLDFGGIGKEYAVDRAVGVAQKLGVRHGFINLGGDLRIIGPHPDGSPWQVGIVHPRKEGEVIKSVALTSGALATSGDYERYFEQDGVRYCHILNPRSGWPVQGFQSVSVLAPSCLVAGSAATTAMLLGPGRGERFLLEGAPASIYLTAKRAHITANITG